MRHLIKAIVVFLIKKFLPDHHLKFKPGKSPRYRKEVKEAMDNTITEMRMEGRI